jgi:PAS domain S-box-containing protein
MSGPSDELLDMAPCGFVSFGDDGRVSIVNATLLERLGYERDELVGRHIETIFTVAGRLFYQTHFFPLVKMHGRAQEMFLLLRTKAGEEVGALCNAVRRPHDGDVSTDCILLEVHERRKYEDALLQARRAAEKTNQLLEAQALELELQHQQLQEQAAELEVQAVAQQELNDELTERTFELERQRAAAEDAQHAADAANRAKSEFLAVMSHELRTPLNAIGGYTQLLETGVYGPVSSTQQEALGRITRSQRHLLGLINDVLNLARVETGRVDYSLEDVVLDDIIAELAAMIEPQIAAKRLVYAVELPESPLVVRADREKLVQILLNLLSNAVKFTPDGGAITMRCALRQNAVDTVLVEVADTGRGIPADKIEAIFEPFVQVRARRSGASEGTGLGLAISRNLARGMGGELTATSVLGAGSSFLLTLTVPRPVA